MDAGALDTKITVLRLIKTRNEYNEVVDSYTKLRDTRAQVLHNSGNKQDINYETQYTVTKTFVVRKYVDIREFDRILYKDKMWNVISIDEDRILNNKTIIATIVNE